MSAIGRLTRNFVVPSMEAVLGRRNLVRFARLLTMESRLDTGNDMADNGETLVHRVLLNQKSAENELVVFDVGANVGEWTKRLIDHSGATKFIVHAFEPASATFSILTKNLADLPSRVLLLNQALSNEVGTASFYVVGAGLGINSLHKGPGQVESTERVQLNTVDAYCRNANISRIDLLKIDAEGHDLSVLEGARAMLQARAISMLQFEYNHRWIESRHFLKDAFELLSPLGYKLGKITGKGIEFYPQWHFELESFREGNYLACLPEWPDRFPQIKWWNLE
ncbi:MAG: hypothetical protein JWN45_1989 [Acidobacteriaceae bacterium]|nr:hypothetical protein [Acidobacteriaceae bacterium]